MSPQKYRLITRSDFDGLVCAVLLNEMNLIDEIEDGRRRYGVGHFDLIIIDEVEQVFAHLLSRTLKPARREVLIHLKHYLKSAKALYLLDADLNRVSVTPFKGKSHDPAHRFL